MSDSCEHDPLVMQPMILISKNGLATLFTDKSCGSLISQALKVRIRKITWQDNFTIESAFELSRAARMCYEIASQRGEEVQEVKLTNLSREDLDILAGFQKHWSFEDLHTNISQLRNRVRLAGPVDPITADIMAKELVDVMTS